MATALEHTRPEHCKRLKALLHTIPTFQARCRACFTHLTKELRRSCMYEAWVHADLMVQAHEEQEKEEAQEEAEALRLRGKAEKRNGGDSLSPSGGCRNLLGRGGEGSKSSFSSSFSAAAPPAQGPQKPRSRVHAVPSDPADVRLEALRARQVAKKYLPTIVKSFPPHDCLPVPIAANALAEVLGEIPTDPLLGLFAVEMAGGAAAGAAAATGQATPAVRTARVASSSGAEKVDSAVSEETVTKQLCLKVATLFADMEGATLEGRRLSNWNKALADGREAMRRERAKQYAVEAKQRAVAAKAAATVLRRRRTSSISHLLAENLSPTGRASLDARGNSGRQSIDSGAGGGGGVSSDAGGKNFEVGWSPTSPSSGGSHLNFSSGGGGGGRSSSVGRSSERQSVRGSFVEYGQYLSRGSLVSPNAQVGKSFDSKPSEEGGSAKSLKSLDDTETSLLKDGLLPVALPVELEVLDGLSMRAFVAFSQFVVGLAISLLDEKQDQDAYLLDESTSIHTSGQAAKRASSQLLNGAASGHQASSQSSTQSSQSVKPGSPSSGDRKRLSCTEAAVLRAHAQGLAPTPAPWATAAAELGLFEEIEAVQGRMVLHLSPAKRSDGSGGGGGSPPAAAPGVGNTGEEKADGRNIPLFGVSSDGSPDRVMTADKLFHTDGEGASPVALQQLNAGVGPLDVAVGSRLAEDIVVGVSRDRSWVLAHLHELALAPDLHKVLSDVEVYEETCSEVFLALDDDGNRVLTLEEIEEVGFTDLLLQTTPCLAHYLGGDLVNDSSDKEDAEATCRYAFRALTRSYHDEVPYKAFADTARAAAALAFHLSQNRLAQANEVLEVAKSETSSIAQGIANLPNDVRGWLFSAQFVRFCEEKFELLLSKGGGDEGKDKGDDDGEEVKATEEEKKNDDDDNEKEEEEDEEEEVLRVDQLRAFLRSVSNVQLLTAEVCSFVNIFDHDGNGVLSRLEFMSFVTWAIVRTVNGPGGDDFVDEGDWVDDAFLDLNEADETDEEEEEEDDTDDDDD